MDKRILIIISLFCISTVFIYAQKTEYLKFNENGEFKIAQFTDLHWNPKTENSKETADIIKYVLSVEKPGLAVLTGDIVCHKPAMEGWTEIARIFEEAKTPWVVLMGNHDAEQDIRPEDIYRFLIGKPYYTGKTGPPNIHGTGNCILPVYKSDNSRPASALYCLDSNDYTQDPIKYGHYDWIRFDQIAWYRNMSQQLKSENNEKPLPSLAFFHIPIPEYNELIESKEYYGERLEKGASSPKVNSGFLASALEMGDIMGTFTGHDHDNSFIGLKNGIALAYGRVTGVNAYGKLERGARIILLQEDKYKFDTWIRTQSGTSELFYYPSGITAEEESNATYHPAKKLEVTKQGVNYKYYEYEGKIKSVHQSTDKNISRLAGEGWLNNFSLSPAEKEDYFSFEYNTWIQIPEDGIYKFYTYTDDGSLLFIDDQLVVDNDGSHSAKRADGRIALKAGFHNMKVLYFESYMGESIEIGISSRNIREMVIPDNMLYVGNR